MQTSVISTASLLRELAYDLPASDGLARRARTLASALEHRPGAKPLADRASRLLADLAARCESFEPCEDDDLLSLDWDA